MPDIRVLNIPEDHDFVRQALPPATVVEIPMTPAQARGWEPSAAFSTAWIRAHRSLFDVVHLHFGFEALPACELAEWAEVLRQLEIPIVFTAHDLRNPHHSEPAFHDASLRVLTSAAAEVVTLTPGAATALQTRFGREAAVIAHPPLLEAAAAGPRSGVVGITLKPRAQVVGPDAIVMSALGGVEAARQSRPGVSLRVSAHPALRSSLPGTVAAAAAGRLVLDELERLPPEEFASALGGLEVAILPYRFGTHSGWLEACRDVGTRVVAPDCGYFAEQWDEVLPYVNNEVTGFDADSLTAATSRALLAGPLPPTVPQQPRVEASRAGYAAVYARAMGRAA